PVALGLVASLARPGGNVTGLSILDRELAQKRLELLKDAFPGLSRVAILWNVTNPSKQLELRETSLVADLLGIQLVSLEVRSPDELESAFDLATREHAEALIVTGDPLTFNSRTQIAALEVMHRLPAMYNTADSVRAGGLLAYGPDRNYIWRRAAVYV